MYDVSFYEAFDEEQKALRHYLPSGIKASFTDRTIQEQADRHPQAPLICIRTQSEIPPDWAPRIRGILTRSTGFDHVRSYLERNSPSLAAGYLPKYCARAVAEQAMLLWTALMRRLPIQLDHFSHFNRDGLSGRECRNSTLLIVGVGSIGVEIADIGRGLGMNVLGVDIVQRFPHVKYVSIEEGLAAADIVTCSMNLTSLNRAYFDAARLATAKQGAVFVNIARGEMAPASDLLQALDSGRLSGVGLDVYENESLLAGSLRAGQDVNDPSVTALLQLARRPNVILTPHNAFNTIEAVDRKSAQTVEQIRKFLSDGTFVWPLPTA
ncbi:MAG TPA: NAD(P)-dependent oxidoreductase [Kiritimatiellia bacterium]|nr:NAD(P)-dependent oxidoreductase [Kiritimatiellia bacterium]